MSHEFKTPLATISVATDALANDKISTNPEKGKILFSTHQARKLENEKAGRKRSQHV